MEGIISISHGNGGKKTSKLIDEIIIPQFNNEALNQLGDGALLKVSGDIAFSTDSFVIDPYFFPGGDIGKLSVCGTVNDLLMCGSVPKYISLALILEEGFKIADLEIIVKSIAETASKAGVKVVTGDTKVVDKGHGHGIYVNTAGIGEKLADINLGIHRIRKGDKVIVSGNVGDHGVSILCAREKLLDSNIISDCTPLNEAVGALLQFKEKVKILRDPTRGGVATTLNEFVEKSNLSIELYENLIPVDKAVKTACDLLGLDPLYSANEGKVLAIVDAEIADKAVEELRSTEAGKEAAIIGEVIDDIASKVLLKSILGGRRVLDKPSHDILPRIC